MSDHDYEVFENRLRAQRLKQAQEIEALEKTEFYTQAQDHVNKLKLLSSLVKQTMGYMSDEDAAHIASQLMVSITIEYLLT